MDILNLLKRNEGKTLEFKQDLSSTEGFLKTVIAFANTAGGIIVIGVEDKTKFIRGIKEPLALEERVANLISDNISPRLVPEIEIALWRQTYLLTVQVYPSSSRPHYLERLGPQKGTYVRVGSTNRVADENTINELKRIVTSESFDELPVLQCNSEAIDFRVTSESFKSFHQIKRSDLETLGLLTKHQGRLVPTVAGVILFGKEREKYFPDAWIQAGRFEGKTKQYIADTIEIRSYPILAIEEAEGFVRKHAMQALKINGLRREEKWSVPLPAIREVLVNAVVHADYSQRGAPIRLAIFEDRIEVENPGLLPFGLTIEDILGGVSKLRNRTIAKIFYRLKLIEHWGSGIQRIKGLCQEWGFDDPRFEEIGTHFRATIYTTPKKKAQSDSVDQKILAALKAAEETGLTTQEIALVIKKTTRSTRTRLLSLIERKLVVEIGTSDKDPKRKYYLST